MVVGPSTTRTINSAGAITATNGYVQFAGHTSVSGLVTTSTGVSFNGDATYSLTNTSNSIPTIAASVGTGTFSLSYSNNLTIGTVGSVSGISAGSVSLTQSSTGTTNLTTINSAISANSGVSVSGGHIVIGASGSVATTTGAITIQPGADYALEIYAAGTVISSTSGAIKLGGNGTTNSVGVILLLQAHLRLFRRLVEV